MIDIDKLSEEFSSNSNSGIPFFSFENKKTGDKMVLRGVAVAITSKFQPEGEFGWFTDPKTGAKTPKYARDWVFLNAEKPFVIETKTKTIDVPVGGKFRIQNGSKALMDSYLKTPYGTGDLVEIRRIGSGPDTSYKLTVISKGFMKPEDLQESPVNEVFPEAVPFAS